MKFAILFKKRDNRSVAPKSGLGKFDVQGGAEPLEGARKSRGAGTPLESMKLVKMGQI